MDVLVTRPLEAARRTADKLGLRGHRALLAPVIAIEPTNAPPPAGPFDAVMMTSAAAMIAEDALGLFADLPAFAVGPRTAEVMRRRFSHVTEGESDVMFMAILLTHALPEGARVLVPTGRDRKDHADEAFAAAGIHLAHWTVYAAEPVRTLPKATEDRIRSGRIDAVLHYSARSAELFAGLVLGLGLTRFLTDVLHVCLSPDVARPLRAALLTRIAVAEKPNEASLLDELDRYGP